MSSELFIFSLGAILGTLLLIFTLRAVVTARQTRQTAADAQAYRDLAARSEAALAQTASRLEGIEAGLARLRASVAAIEAMLGEVG